MENFGHTIKKIRLEKKIQLRIVASFLGIDTALLSKIERGQRSATKAQVLKLSKFYKIKEDQLLTSWLSDKIVYELSEEPIALKALHLAEEKVNYANTISINRKTFAGKIKSILKNFDAIQQAWIFGSFAREEENHNSDLDILIDVPPNKKFTLFDIAEIQDKIQTAFHRKADVVMLSAIKPSVKKNVLQDMKLIYEAK